MNSLYFQPSKLKPLEGMMNVMNIMCGNVEYECAFAAIDHFESVRDGRDIFEHLGK